MRIKPFKEPVFITRPVLPSIDKVMEKIKEIWDSKWLTNMGTQHKELEVRLNSFLKVRNLTLFCNGTLALQLAHQVLNLKGEVITTPFTFPATITSLYQTNLKPVYCDIKEEDFNLNPSSIVELINSKTSAILGVHVFGNPCQVEQIEKIAGEYNLKVIYDAAHCFGVEYKNKGIGTYGDISMFSFHTTKLFHTIEGGCLTYKDSNLKEKLYLLKNFGIANEEEVILPGTNAKMNEFQASIGLLLLDMVNDEIIKRKYLSKIYFDNLNRIDGINLPIKKRNVKYNYQYFPILIDGMVFKKSRDNVYEELKQFNVFPRKYFYPLGVNFQFERNRKNQFSIPIANKISNQILCLPLYGGLKQSDVEKICDIIKSLNR